MDVVLAVLPFADVDRPAIGVSVLKAEVAARGFDCSVAYLNFDLAEAIGFDLYTTLSESIPTETLVGEWFFADLVFGDDIPHEERFIHRILSPFAARSVIEKIRSARAVRRTFVERAAARLAATGAPIVGFTTTFHQTCACLAVARRLKELPSPPSIVFGGANCEGVMGLQLLRSFPSYVDFVCTREGDVALPELVERLLRGDASDSRPMRPIPGLIGQASSRELSLPALVVDLDAVPAPDYADYLVRLEDSPLKASVHPELLIETSRGCWWGAKHHCTFCGLNGDTMRFRSKSPDRVYDELAALRSTYGVRKIDCVDNILDLRYVRTLFQRLIEQPLDVELFYEVKANLSRPQLGLLSRAGVRRIQPGIESFSNAVLRLMDKGCTGLHNIQLLRWCRVYAVEVAWNVLAGFPGEDPEAYAEMAALLPQLGHLQPPTSCSPIRLDRFSPLFVRSREVGLGRVRPKPAYYYVYPLPERELAQLAYFFDFDYPDGRDPNRYLGSVKREVEAWLTSWAVEPTRRPTLDAALAGSGQIRLTDSRSCARGPAYELDGVAAKLYVACDAIQTVDSLVAETCGVVSRAEIQTQLEAWREAKLVVEMDGRWLALAVIPDDVIDGIRSNRVASAA
jgi:ribosomal peptide maturation radical SAM protein 1